MGTPLESATETVPRLVSVVIAAYNAEASIEETCRSAMAQTYEPIEIVVVDDGSTDRTAQIVEGLARVDGRVRLHRQANAGAAAARNAGIVMSRGEFVSVLDADDLWAPTKIARQVSRLDEAGRAAALSYCWWLWIDEHGHVLDRSPCWRVEGRVHEKLLQINFTGNTSVPLFRRSAVLEAGGYDATLWARGYQGSEDLDLALKIAERFELVAVPAVLVAYRRQPGGMSTACQTMFRSRAAVTSAFLERHPEISRRVRARSDGQYALYLAGVAFWSGQRLEMLRWLVRVRPPALAIKVLPHLAKLAVQRLVAPGTSGVVMTADRLGDDRALPQPLVPYDRIYADFWTT